MIKKILSYWLIAIFMISTLYIPIYKHTCHLFNKSETSILKKPDHCCTDSNEANIGFRCCSLSVKTLAVDHQAVIGDEASLNEISIICQFIPVDFNQSYSSPFFLGKSIVRPPPVLVSGRSSLSMNQIFRI
ncbi:MAG: hypothetical protein JXR03_16670 [Cyclobacteriaceae bacterium]